jgi:hypothetical protein
MANTTKDIKYLNRDFSNIRSSLIEFSKTYYPNTYNDFSTTSPGMMFMEMSAYIGDVLSFYLDNQLLETYTQLARQDNNLYELAYMFGYKPKTSTAAITTVELFQQVPSKLINGEYVPDLDYTLIIPENTSISSNQFSNINFLIQDFCDFKVSSSLDPTEVSIYEVSGTDPLYFLLKKTRKAISATINTQTFTFGEHTSFPTINITGNNILKILDIFDSDGNQYFEVDYLGQEMVFDNIKNTNTNDPNNIADVGEVPYLLKLKKVQRRYITRFTSENNLQIQFGAGNPNNTDELITPNPNNVGMGLPFEQDKLTTAFSPVNFLFTNTYGIAPTDTTLTIRYLTGGGVEANVPSGDLTTLNTSNVKFNSNNLNDSSANYVFGTLAINNLESADGGSTGDSITQIRQNTISSILAQQRSVTLNDYKIRALSMPSDFGSVSKAYIEKPNINDNFSSTINTLSLYVLGQNNAGQLTTASNSLKNNLRTYLSQYKIIGDSIEIKDAFIINISIDFEIIVLPNNNNNTVILNCITSLKNYFSIDNWQINEPIILRDLYVRLDKIEGVQTVKNIEFNNKTGVSLGYSQYAYDIPAATQNQVIYPSLDPSIFEVKYPNTDIKGKVVPL